MKVAETKISQQDLRNIKQVNYSCKHIKLAEVLYKTIILKFNSNNSKHDKNFLPRYSAADNFEIAQPEHNLLDNK